uniref:AlNc14C180G8206 protein n=1 Tax=Albugo laibachii Nc14 TaxID=890382 RepID=F0WP59_9STRA|nr:AlNc14C180G8206 [Albugo laibachii Nc14]|eukprot:CCA23103.1 AlNc14C180G8206 [Albugo laibachii Nc14]
MIPNEFCSEQLPLLFAPSFLPSTKITSANSQQQACQWVSSLSRVTGLSVVDMKNLHRATHRTSNRPRRHKYRLCLRKLRLRQHIRAENYEEHLAGNLVSVIALDVLIYV